LTNGRLNGLLRIDRRTIGGKRRKGEKWLDGCLGGGTEENLLYLRQMI
jgi:hypothetical protein